ncbi:hypothetical protein CYMTET_13480 [Cymbomonas tetramitiformis]|uniref:DNA helicase n=1 Tax=Cymbomonas tetramitiformis TaxID=36881 RepID=A0AAE0GIF0_9CHLO|nr:hypothetical protein CYMTET_13480 [Cymbomonas tetramitiformis]
MHRADQNRKQQLVESGFRLPSALDHRPLTEPEFWDRVHQTIFVSATPGRLELELCQDPCLNSEDENMLAHEYMPTLPSGLRATRISALAVDGASSAAGGLAELVLRPERRAATPALDASGEEVGSWGMSEGVAELLMRPTGILDPAVHVRPSAGQADDLLGEVHTRIARGERSLVSVVTKVAAEELSAFLKGHGVRSAYMHSDVKALDRMSILEALKDGRYDALVGVNLLREGLDLPEVSLVAIVDADKEGFLRSATSLIQTIGRAARHVSGTAILYADRRTASMEAAIGETDRRRCLQAEYNRANGISPRAPSKKGTYNALLHLVPGEGPSLAHHARRAKRNHRVGLSADQLRVYDAVYKWRSEMALLRRCKPFRVVQAKTIRQLAIHQPRSEKELLDVFGIGPVKLEDFGSQLLMLVEDASAAESA